MEMPYDIYPEVYNEFVGHNALSIEDVTLLLKKSGFEPEKIRKAIKLADKQEYINNYMGWLIKCIEEDYEEIDVIKGDRERTVETKEIQKSYEVNKEETGKRVWEKAKSNEDFRNYLQETGANVEYLESAFDIDKCVEMYLSWNMSRFGKS